MSAYELKLELRSPTLTGSGEGFGALIDVDVVFDDLGLPYIPAKRVKGCLRDSALEVLDMFIQAGIGFKDGFEERIDAVFGIVGSEHTADVIFDDLYLEDYPAVRAWIAFWQQDDKTKSLFSKDAVREVMTVTRQQTRIENDGTALDGSLRTSRLIRAGLTFIGDVLIKDDDIAITETLALACMNFRAIGTSRNRGLGEVRCMLIKNKKSILNEKRLEALCTA